MDEAGNNCARKLDDGVILIPHWSNMDLVLLLLMNFIKLRFVGRATGKGNFWG